MVRLLFLVSVLLFLIGLALMFPQGHIVRELSFAVGYVLIGYFVGRLR